MTVVLLFLVIQLFSKTLGNQCQTSHISFLQKSILAYPFSLSVSTDSVKTVSWSFLQSNNALNWRVKMLHNNLQFILSVMVTWALSVCAQFITSLTIGLLQNPFSFLSSLPVNSQWDRSLVSKLLKLRYYFDYAQNY